MKPPIEGMKTIPEGIGTPFMTVFWASGLRCAIAMPGIVERFENETGIKITSIATSSGLDAMIDEASGRTRNAVIAFADWFTTNIWGEQNKQPDTDV